RHPTTSGSIGPLDRRPWSAPNTGRLGPGHSRSVRRRWWGSARMAGDLGRGPGRQSMDTHDRSTDAVPGGPAATPSAATAPRPSPGGMGPAPGRAGALWAAALSAGLVAGVAAWLIGEAAHEYIKPEVVKVVIMNRAGGGPTIETRNVATVKNAMLIFGVLGAV